MSGATHGRRSEMTIRKCDLNEGSILRDEVYGEQVKVVGLYVGKVYLRYPHQEKKHTYRHECGASLLGMDELKEHAENCDEGNPEWWDTTDPDRLTEMSENGECPYEQIEIEGMHIEACDYDWPLDGHRFTVVEK